MLPPLRVVHIEDNALNRSLVEALFAAYPQVHLHSAETAAEGQESIERLRPDVALVDINLPDGSGLDLCRRVRANPTLKQLPLIALSADALPEHIAARCRPASTTTWSSRCRSQRLLSILADPAQHPGGPAPPNLSAPRPDSPT